MRAQAKKDVPGCSIASKGGFLPCSPGRTGYAWLWCRRVKNTALLTRPARHGYSEIVGTKGVPQKIRRPAARRTKGGAGMALIECPECQKEVSSKAAACPYCGHPIAAAKDEKSKGARGRGCAVFILLMIGLVVLLSYLGGKEEKLGGVSTPKQKSASEEEEKPISCTSDWHKCSDNADLINHYNGIIDAQVSCQSEAENRARYGSPKWPFLSSFSTFYSGDQYEKTGLAVLIEKDAQFSNAFGAMEHSTVTCTYDLNQKKVVDISITPN